MKDKGFPSHILYALRLRGNEGISREKTVQRKLFRGDSKMRAKSNSKNIGKACLQYINLPHFFLHNRFPSIETCLPNQANFRIAGPK